MTAIDKISDRLDVIIAAMGCKPHKLYLEDSEIKALGEQLLNDRTFHQEDYRKRSNFLQMAMEGIIPEGAKFMGIEITGY